MAEAAALDAGTYTIVASTFEPGQLASFVLRVGSEVPVQLRPVLSDAAGRLRTTLAPVTFGGLGSGGRKTRRARLTVARLTKAGVVARSGFLTTASSGGSGGSNDGSQLPPSLGGSASTTTTTTSSSGGARSGTASPISVPVSLRVSIEYGTGAHRVTAAVTGDGEFADASMGLRMAEVDLDPDAARGMGGLWLVVEQMGTHREGQGIQVDVLSDGRVGVGSWEAVDD